MTNYKKEEPRPYPDWGQLHTPRVPKTVEHYLADILRSLEILEKHIVIHPLLDSIKNSVRKAWDLVPEEKETIKVTSSFLDAYEGVHGIRPYPCDKCGAIFTYDEIQSGIKTRPRKKEDKCPCQGLGRLNEK